MKIRSYIFQIANDEAHDRNVCRLMDRAEELGLYCTRSAIGTGLESGTAVLFEGIQQEYGLPCNESIERVNKALESLRNGLDLSSEKPDT